MFIKAMPKSPVVKEFLYPEVKPVNLNAFGSVVGTKSNDDTIVALKGVNNLLSSGILRGPHNDLLKETMVPMFPTLHIRENVDQERIRTGPIVETREPVLTEVIKPTEEKVNVQVPFEPNYSYEQMQNNKPEMTYAAHYNPNVKVVETIQKKAEVPMCIRQRVNEVIRLGADSYRVAPLHAVFPYQGPPVDDSSNFNPKVETHPYVRNPSYPTILKEQMFTVAKFGLSPKPLKVVQTNHNVREPVKTQAVKSRLLPLYKFPHLDVVNINVPKNNDNSLVGKVDDENVPKFDTRIGISQTLGPIPPQYISHSTKKELVQGNKDKTADKQSTSNMRSNGNISNGMIPINVYKQQSNPNTAKVVKLDDKVKTNTNTKSNVKMPSNYYYVPPIINSEAPKTQEINTNNGVHTNKITSNHQTVLDSVIPSKTNGLKENLLKENEISSLKVKPTLESTIQHYIYQQKNADGSSMNVQGNKKGVSVNVKESIARRGDIPDEVRK